MFGFKKKKKVSEEDEAVRVIVAKALKYYRDNYYKDGVKIIENTILKALNDYHDYLQKKLEQQRFYTANKNDDWIIPPVKPE